MSPLASEIPVGKRQTTLQMLLARIQANARPLSSAPRVARPAPVAATPPAVPAQERITAFDDRWGGPPAKAAAQPQAKPVAAPTAAPSGDRGVRLNSLLERILKNGRRH